MKNTNTSYGNNSTNIGKAENVVLNYNNQEPTKIDYSKKSLKEFAVSPLKLSLSGFLSFGGLMITYFSLFFKYPILELPTIINVLPFLGILTLIAVTVGITLKNRRFIPFLSIYSLESDGKSIFLKRTKTKCPICHSSMRIFRKEDGVFVSCKRNPELHSYSFDYTTFIDNE
ncbi:hypothetical protein [Labilibaculum manganireducens]|uniref:hypothetical protein n=1 Tax=Labilibaculum manganireducens TaxID=1940525 RepID=UPI0029F4C942|nr:hypothetical protein [Labilibaculum manganireducens]